MKTLDEVIYHLENCAYAPLTDDALHYLKEYKNTDENYKRAIAHVTEVIDQYEKMVADYLAVNNPPLTFDELKQMEGKPVWVEGSAFANGHWIILGGCYENGGAEYVFIDGDQYWKEDMKDADDGVSWQAYRKER